MLFGQNRVELEWLRIPIRVSGFRAKSVAGLVGADSILGDTAFIKIPACTVDFTS